MTLLSQSYYIDSEVTKSFLFLFPCHVGLAFRLPRFPELWVVGITPPQTPSCIILILHRAIPIPGAAHGCPGRQCAGSQHRTLALMWFTRYTVEIKVLNLLGQLSLSKMVLMVVKLTMLNAFSWSRNATVLSSALALRRSMIICTLMMFSQPSLPGIKPRWGGLSCSPRLGLVYWPKPS